MAPPPSKSLDEVIAMMAQARTAGRLQTVRKTRPVDARPARPGEIVVTIINGEKETQSPPAKPGDWVVRNRCPETGNEEYLVAADKFDAKYRRTGVPGAHGWRECRPVAKDRRALILTPEEGSFTFKAPWGEAMIAHPGDALVQDPDDERDTYRVEKRSFACTYETSG